MVPSEISIDFVTQLGNEIRSKARSAPMLASLAFFLRPANIRRIADRFQDSRRLRPRGLVVHVAPRNVSLNFAYPLVISMIAGNSNRVKLPSIDENELDFFVESFRAVLSRDKFSELRENNELAWFARDDVTLGAWFQDADLRLAWGSNDSIQSIRRFPIKSDAIDIGFAERESFGLISTPGYSRASESERSSLAQQIRRDLLFADHRACTSPLMLIFTSDMPDDLYEDLVWRIRTAKTYDRRELASSYRTFVDLLDNRLRSPSASLAMDSTMVAGISFSRILESTEGIDLRPGHLVICSLDRVPSLVQHPWSPQTCVYGLMEANEARDILGSVGIDSVDRLVRFGNAHSFSLVWDGIDLVGVMTRQSHEEP